MDYNYPPYKYEIPRYPEQPPRPVQQPVRKKSNPMINLALFLATVLSTLFFGSILEGGNPTAYRSDLLLGIPFSFTLLMIIGVHELGHYIACRVHGVDATLPYFIPAPTIIGTLGAVIKIKSPITSNKALFDIGAAGPIAGFIVTLPALYYGLMSSEVRETANIAGSISFGDPLIMKFAIQMVLGDIPEGFTVYISSIGFAGWVGLIVTAFNLMPLGQLDGGHIAYALLGRRQTYLGYFFFACLFVFLFFWWGWIFWIIIALITKIKHPRGISPPVPLDSKRKMIGILCLILFILCFVPVPIEGIGLLEMFGNFVR